MPLLQHISHFSLRNTFTTRPAPKGRGREGKSSSIWLGRLWRPYMGDLRSHVTFPARRAVTFAMFLMMMIELNCHSSYFISCDLTIKVHRVLSYHNHYLCMCTKNSISQDPFRRQHTDRWAIHARHQLCVKGFCYLCTVIVTAAVCFRLWAGLKHYTYTALKGRYVLAVPCVFSKQSPVMCSMMPYVGPLVCRVPSEWFVLTYLRAYTLVDLFRF